MKPQRVVHGFLGGLVAAGGARFVGKAQQLRDSNAEQKNQSPARAIKHSPRALFAADGNNSSSSSTPRQRHSPTQHTKGAPPPPSPAASPQASSTHTHVLTPIQTLQKRVQHQLHQGLVKVLPNKDFVWSRLYDSTTKMSHKSGTISQTLPWEKPLVSTCSKDHSESASTAVVSQEERFFQTSPKAFSRVSQQ